MVQASKNIGNTELENKFSEAIKLLKRDIVFAASLYLQTLLEYGETFKWICIKETNVILSDYKANL